MWAVIIIAVLALPVGVAMAILSDLERGTVDSAAARLRDNPAISKRAPYFPVLWRIGGVLAGLAVMPVAICLHGATADQWRTMGEVSAGLLATGSVFLGLWWLLASRQVADSAPQA